MKSQFIDKTPLTQYDLMTLQRNECAKGTHRYSSQKQYALIFITVSSVDSFKVITSTFYNFMQSVLEKTTDSNALQLVSRLRNCF